MFWVLNFLPDTERTSRDKLGSKNMGVAACGSEGGRGGDICRIDKRFHRFIENYNRLKCFESVSQGHLSCARDSGVCPQGCKYIGVSCQRWRGGRVRSRRYTYSSHPTLEKEHGVWGSEKRPVNQRSGKYIKGFRRQLNLRWTPHETVSRSCFEDVSLFLFKHYLCIQ